METLSGEGVGVRVATLPVASSATVAVTAGERKKVLVLMVAGFIAEEKFAVTTGLRQTPMALAGGVMVRTVGVGPAVMQVLAPVVKVAV